MKVKAILFDADGVIAISERYDKQYCRKFGISSDDMQPFFNGIFQEALVGKADLKEIIAPYVKGWNWDGDVEGFLKWWFDAESPTDKRFFEFVPTIRKKKIKCFLATNQEKYRTEYIKDQMNLKKIMDDFYSSARVGHKKPSKEFFEFIIDDLKEKYDIKPEEIMFFDDSIEHVKSAKTLKIKAYLYDDFDKMKKEIEKNI